MASKVYFGNDQKQTWILAPKGEMTTTSTSKTTITDLLSGRRHIKRTNGASRSFPVSWLGSMNSSDMTESLHTIKDFADGLYGDSPFYWLDPFAMSSNLMPPHWAAPMLAEHDWPMLKSGATPTFTSDSGTNGYPIKDVMYGGIAGGYVGDKKVVLIIPSGYTLHFGWHSRVGGESAATTGGIRIKRYNRSTNEATEINPVALAGGTTRTNTTVSGTTYKKVEIYLANGSVDSDNIFIHAMIAQILPDGASVPTGNFISGRGTTGLDFSDSVEIQYYTSALMDGMIGLSTTLMEVD